MKIISAVFLILGVIAFGVGIYLFVDPTLLSELDHTVRIVLGSLLVLYGVFRVSTALGGLRKKKQAAK